MTCPACINSTVDGGTPCAVCGEIKPVVSTGTWIFIALIIGMFALIMAASAEKPPPEPYRESASERSARNAREDIAEDRCMRGCYNDYYIRERISANDYNVCMNDCRLF